ncbi:MAG: DUF1501 domain-containing protein [Gemmataceae bacterium]|nr:DUF1501 domain-containing protein [Gemmataceae bacterium]
MLDIRFDRRNFLRLGAVGALAGLAHAGTEKTRKHRAKNVLLVYLGGGLSHHDSFDPKPDAPPEVRGIYKTQPTTVPGLIVTEKLPRMAKAMHRLALVRSGAHNNDHHETATNWVMSGRFGSAFGDFPAIGAVVAHESGFRGELPPYVSIPRNPSFTWELGKSAFLGGRYESFKTGDPNAPGFKVEDVAPATDIGAKRAARRKSLLAAVDDLAKKVEGNDLIGTYDEFRERAATMVLSAEARSAFAIDKESARVRDRYGRNTFGQSALLARRLVERGVKYVTVNYGGWDHHAKIWDGLKNKLPEFDTGFSALIEDLDERGLLADTLVVCMGEFGRTPKINKDTGRDHWAPAASLLFVGAGVKRGLVLGATDKQGAFATRRPVAPADVACTIYESLGIDPRKQLVTPDGRPIEILDTGDTVKELFA